MRRRLAIVLIFAGFAGPAAAAPVAPDTRMDHYFSIWADDAKINPATVASLYARSVSSYGKRMSPVAVYRDKLAFVRRWPSRRYGVVPGSVSKTCDAAEDHCRVGAVLSWERADAGRHAGAEGANTITLDLVREDGTLKIALESGRPIAEAACRPGGDADWRCTAYRQPPEQNRRAVACPSDTKTAPHSIARPVAGPESL